MIEHNKWQNVDRKTSEKRHFTISSFQIECPSYCRKVPAKALTSLLLAKTCLQKRGSVTHTFHTGSFPFWVFKSKQVQQMTNDKWTLGLSSICLINLMQTKLRFNSNERPHGIWESRWQSTISSLTKNYITISMQKNQFDLNSLRYSRFQSLLTMST